MEEALIPMPLPRRFRTKFIVLASLASIFIIALGVFGTTAVSIYYKQLSLPWILPIARTLPFPAFLVDDRSISYDAFLSEHEAVRKILEDKTKEDKSDPPLSAEIIERIVARYVRALAVERIAFRENIVLEEVDIEQVKAKLIFGFKNDEDYRRALKERYGWSPEVFESKVVRPYALEEKVLMALRAKKMDGAQKSAAQLFEEIKKKPNDFGIYAKKFSSDGTKDRGGDLGWFGRGTMIKEFEEAVFAMKKNDLEVVKTKFGYHLIRLDAIRGAGVAKEVRASHILIQPQGMEETIKQEMGEITTRVLVKA